MIRRFAPILFIILAYSGCEGPPVPFGASPDYTIEFNGNGGTRLDGNGTEPYKKIYPVGKKAYLPEGSGFDLAGKIFAGWARTAEGEIEFQGGGEIIDIADPGKTAELFAVWKPMWYIEYKANGGTGTMNNSVCIQGVAKKLPSGTFSRPGFQFKGWGYSAATSPDSPDYVAGASVPYDRSILNSSDTLELYALWGVITLPKPSDVSITRAAPTLFVSGRVIIEWTEASGDFDAYSITYYMGTDPNDAVLHPENVVTLNGISKSSNNSSVYAVNNGIFNRHPYVFWIHCAKEGENGSYDIGEGVYAGAASALPAVNITDIEDSIIEARRNMAGMAATRANPLNITLPALTFSNANAVKEIFDAIPGRTSNIDYIRLNLSACTLPAQWGIIYANLSIVKISSLVLPSSVTSIVGNEGARAFDGWSNLTQLTIPGVTSIAEYSFYQSGIKSMSTGALQTVGDYAFYECTALENSKAGSASLSGLKSAGRYAFAKCGLISDLDCAKSTLESISEGAFADCSGLTELDITAAGNIGSGAFENCQNLAVLKIANKTFISERAFKNCTALGSNGSNPVLTNALIIESEAFYGCPNIEELLLNKTTSVAQNAFYDCSKLAVLELKLCVDIGAGAFINTKLGEANNASFKLGVTPPTLSESPTFPERTVYVGVPTAKLSDYNTWKSYHSVDHTSIRVDGDSSSTVTEKSWPVGNLSFSTY